MLREGVFYEGVIVVLRIEHLTKRYADKVAAADTYKAARYTAL